MRYSHIARFAYVHLNGARAVEEMREALALPCHTCDSVLVFNDFPEVRDSIDTAISTRVIAIAGWSNRTDFRRERIVLERIRRE